MRILWISDGKPGHEQQSLGLIQAFNRELPITYEKIAPLANLLPLRFQIIPSGTFNLIIAAGRTTQWSAYRLAQHYQAPSVILMRPELPYSMFDACVVPAHDNPPMRENVFITQGALNTLYPPFIKDEEGLILIGGQSKHFIWNDTKIIDQIEKIVCQVPDKIWHLTTSRRTPTSFLTTLSTQESLSKLKIMPYEKSEKEWLMTTLKRADEVIVTPDSVSMMYEALTAACQVRVLTLQAKQQSNKLLRNLVILREKGWVGDADQRPTQMIQLQEATRAAKWLINRLQITVHSITG